SSRRRCASRRARCSRWPCPTTTADMREADGAPRIGLVLGSGGARGLAQIGVIEEIEARGLRIASIAGTSIGALVGGLHAAGKLGAYRDWLLGMDRNAMMPLLESGSGAPSLLPGQWALVGGLHAAGKLGAYRDWLLGMDRNAMLRLLDPGWGRSSLFTGQRLLAALREVCGSPRIEELPIDFTAVAVDLMRHREVWLRQGDMWDAVRASFAIPGVFTPQVINGRALVDGGLLAPLPLTAMRMADADTVIAVDLNGPPREREQQAPVETEGGATRRWWPLRRHGSDEGHGASGARLGFLQLMT